MDKTKVKEYEVNIVLKPLIFKAIAKLDKFLTDRDFVFDLCDYYQHLKPRFIDLTKPQEVNLVVKGVENATGEKNFVIKLQAH